MVTAALIALLPVFAELPIARIAASADSGGKYGIESAIDRRPNTQWAAGNRPPVWIRAEFPGPQQVSRIRIRQCAQTTIYDNWRRVSLSFSDGSNLCCLLGDQWQEQVVSFARRESRWVRITIESTYKTSYYVGLTEIAFDDEGPASQGRSGIVVTPPPKTGPAPTAKNAPRPPVAEDRSQALLTHLSPKRIGSAAHPTLFMSADDAERAKANVRRHDWARKQFAGILAAADAWLAMSDDQLRALVPHQSAMFDNKAACPQCGGQCTVDLLSPGTVYCRQCKKAYPDAEHPDDGHGWKNPQSGEVTYFVGLYNSVAVDRLTDGMQHLADAYVITGDDRYAHAASILLDSLAAIYPSCDKGPVWYPGVGGRLNRPFYQTARTLIYYAAVYDQTYHSPQWDRPSCAPGALSRRTNYENNLLTDGAQYCFAQVLKQPSPGLHNGNCDYLQGALAVGRVLGVQRYIDYVLESNLSIFNFIENTIDRDGQYYETSFGYSRHAVDLFSHHAEMLWNYRSPKYPRGVNLYEHAKLRMNFLRAESDIDCAGHQPALGDSGPDLLVIRPDNRDALLARVYDRLEMLLARTARLEEKRALERRLWQLSDGDVEGCRGRSPNARWLLFHADDVAAPAADNTAPAAAVSTLLGAGRGIAILRSGAEAGAQCALLRYGPTLNHGSADELNVNLYALGREISYDQGYGWAHHRAGWAHSTVAHNVVVVNEKNQLQGGQGAGGSLEQYGQSPRVRIAAADDPLAYAGAGVDRYRRLLAMVDTGTGSAYVLDVFDVQGGSRHDLSQHFAGSLARTEGATFGPPQTTGSLAGPQYEWWKLIQPSGWIAGQKKPFYWNAPPENGYGFLFDVQPSVAVSAAPRFTWKLGDRETSDPPQLLSPAQCKAETSGCACRTSEAGCSVVAANQSGDWLALRTSVEVAGEYLVLARFQKSAAAGIVGVAIDGKRSEAAFNAYSPVTYLGELVTLGRARLEAGVHELRFECRGKDAESAGHAFALQCFALARPAALEAIGQKQTEGLALTVLPPPDSRLVLAKAKGLATAPQSDYLFVRRSGRDLTSRFVSVIEPFVGPGPTLTATPLTADGNPGACPAGVKVVASGGRTDYFFDCPAGSSPLSGPVLKCVPLLGTSSAGAHEKTLLLRSSGTPSRAQVPAPAHLVAFRDGDTWIRFQGRFAAVLTRAGKPTEMLLSGPQRLSIAGLEITADRPAYCGNVVGVDYEKSLVTVDVSLAQAAAGGQLACFTRPSYSRNAPYLLGGVASAPGGSRLDLAGASLVLGRGRATAEVSATGLLANGVPLDRERAYGRLARTRYFDGKAIRNLRTGQLGRIKNANLDASLALDVNPGLGKGDAFELLDVQVGDRVTIPAVVALWQTSPGEWLLRSNVSLTVDVPGARSLCAERPEGRIEPLAPHRWHFAP